MNKAQQKLQHYARLISSVMDATEGQQDTLGPLFDRLRKAIDDDQLASVSDEDYAATREAFAAGTAVYETQLTALQQATAPARMMGNHQLLTAAYADFVAGCQAMTASLGDGKAALDQSQFDAAEKAQDEATEKLMKRLQRVSALT